MIMRYNDDTATYRDCKFCHGAGCLACPGEADKEYKRQFPDGPKPIATFKIDNPDDMRKCKKLFSALTGGKYTTLLDIQNSTGGKC